MRSGSQGKRWVQLLCSAATLATVGCEHASPPNPLRWSPPGIGDRWSARWSFQNDFLGPRGEMHHGRMAAETTTVVRGISNGSTSVLEVVIERQEHTLDGKPMPTFTGTFELRRSGSKIDVTKVGGALTAKEREFFSDAWATSMDSSARKSFLAHSFRLEEHYRPTRAEGIGLGFDPVSASTLELVVDKIDAVEIGFRVSYDIPSDVMPTLHMTGRLVLSNTSRDSVQDGDYIRDGSTLGKVHVESHARRLSP